MADITLAANNPDLGGGEQMLLRHAEVLLDLDHAVTVVAPDSPTEVLDAAAKIGAGVVAIRADGRRDYVTRLRSWDRAERLGLLWCHGLVPALATSGHRDRVIHLHQLPRNKAQRLALGATRPGSTQILSPSVFLSSQVRGAVVCANWTDRVTRLQLPTGQRRVGFLGRLSTDKGLDVLANAVASDTFLSDVQLLAAGDDRWVPEGQRTTVTHALEPLAGRVTLPGRLTPAEFFADIDLAVFPSRVDEAFGLVVAEAMASGVPFVISDAGALPEVAGPDHPWVARRGDVADLARVLAEALSASDETRRAVTDAARARWEAEYSPAAGRQRVARLLEELDIS